MRSVKERAGAWISHFANYPDDPWGAFPHIVLLARHGEVEEIVSVMPRDFLSVFRKWVEEIVIEDPSKPIFVLSYGTITDSTKHLLAFKKYFENLPK